MTREESKMMQGVAILTMIFYHLFYPNEVNFLANMARAANPVAFYVFISGYGLYASQLIGGGQKTVRTNCFHLFPILDDNSSQVGDLLVQLGNLLLALLQLILQVVDKHILLVKLLLQAAHGLLQGFRSSTLLSQLLFKIIDRISPVMTLLLSFGVYVASSYMNHRFVWFGANVFQTFYILFPFVLGALVAKYGVIDKAKAAMNNRHLALPYLLLFLLLTIRYFVYSGAFAALFATIFIMLFVCADKPKWLEMTLMHLGKASFYMWLVHAWICWYLLRDEIYGLENPLLIFCATTLLSYVLALIFHSLTNPILKKM